MYLIAATGILIRMTPWTMAFFLVGILMYLLGRILQSRKARIYQPYNLMRFCGLIFIVIAILKIVFRF